MTATSPLDTQVRHLLTDRDIDPATRARLASELIAATAAHLPPAAPFAWHRWLDGKRVEVSARPTWADERRMQAEYDSHDNTCGGCRRCAA